MSLTTQLLADAVKKGGPGSGPKGTSHLNDSQFQSLASKVGNAWHAGGDMMNNAEYGSKEYEDNDNRFRAQMNSNKKTIAGHLSEAKVTPRAFDQRLRQMSRQATGSRRSQNLVSMERVLGGNLTHEQVAAIAAKS